MHLQLQIYAAILKIPQLIQLIGNSPHSSYAMFGQPDYPPNGYAGYNPSYHYSNPYLNSSGTSGYSMSVTGEYNPNTAAFGMPPPQHLPSDIKLSKDR